MGNLRSSLRNMAVREEHGAEDVEMRVANNRSNFASNTHDAQNNGMEAPAAGINI